MKQFWTIAVVVYVSAYLCPWLVGVGDGVERFELPPTMIDGFLDAWCAITDWTARLALRRQLKAYVFGFTYGMRGMGAGAFD